MEKITGQQLKKDIKATKTKLNNLQGKIDKKFNLIINEYPQYIPDEYKTFLANNSVYDIDNEFKLDIIIATEAEYIRQTSNQGDFFIK